MTDHGSFDWSFHCKMRPRSSEVRSFKLGSLYSIACQMFVVNCPTPGWSRKVEERWFKGIWSQVRRYNTDAWSNQCLNKKDEYARQSWLRSSRLHDHVTPKHVERSWTIVQSPPSLESLRMQTKLSTIVRYIHELMYVTCLSVWNSDGSHKLLYLSRVWQFLRVSTVSHAVFRYV